MAQSLRVFATSSLNDAKPVEPLHPLIFQAVFDCTSSSPNVSKRIRRYRSGRVGNKPGQVLDLKLSLS